MKVLFVDCCLKEGKASRTRLLCQAFLKSVAQAHPEYETETLLLDEEEIYPYRNGDVEKRNELLRNGELDHPIFAYARQFAEADRIVIGAPYWDLSFPSLLKIYMEHIFVNKITFAYEDTKSVGLCKAGKMLYIQTAGGFVGEEEPGAAYLKAVCGMLGIQGFERICADGIDIQEIPQEPRIRRALEEIQAVAADW